MSNEVTQDDNTFNAQEAYDQTIQDIFAESSWEKYEADLARKASQEVLTNDMIEALEIGNKYTQGNQTSLSDSNYSSLPIAYSPATITDMSTYGHSGLTEEQAIQAASRYKIICYHANDSTGFSGILIFDTQTNNYILEFRSTEYAADFQRDAMGADQSIKNTGFPIAQLDSANNWYQSLISSGAIPSGSVVNLGGYSLGGALASSIYAMYPNNFSKLQLENAPGIGMFGNNSNPTSDETINNITNMINEYNSYMTQPNNFLQNIFSNFISKNHTLSDLSTVLNCIENIGLDQSGQFELDTTDAIPDNVQILISDITPDLQNMYNLMTSYPESFSFIKNGLLDALEFGNTNLLANNASSKGNNNNIYDDPFYQLVQSYIHNKYNTSAYNSGVWDALSAEFQTGTTGATDIHVFDSNKVSDYRGLATFDYFNSFGSNQVSTDFSFVADSGIHAPSNAVFIEAQPTFEDYIGQLPVLSSLTGLLKNYGDFGNTHSITLIEDSLRAMTIFQDLDSSATLQQLNDILSAANNEHATFHAFSTEQNTTETDTISKAILSLAKLFDSNQTRVENFEQFIQLTPTSEDTFANKSIREQIQNEEDVVAQSITNNNATIINLYNYQNGISAINSMPTVAFIVAQAMQNNDIGMAYRYALRELNSFVVEGVDYTTQNTDGTLDLDAHSLEWYTQRARILEEIIAENVNNSDEYFDTANVVITNTDPSNPLSFNFVNSTQYLIDEDKKNLSFSTIIKPGLSKTIFDTQINLIENNSLISGGTQGNIIFGNSNLDSYTGSKYNDYIFTGNSNNNYVQLNNLSDIKQGINSILSNIFNNNIFNTGTDYVETKGITIINCGNETNNFCLSGINDIYGSNGEGSLSLDGYVLTGGNYDYAQNYYVDQNYSNIIYQYQSDGTNSHYLVVENTQNEDKVYFYNTQYNDNTNYNFLGLNLTYNNSTVITNTVNDLTSTINNLFTSSVNQNYLGLIDGNTYTTIPNEMINFNQTLDNTAIYKNGNDLYLYDEINKTSIKLSNYFSQVTIYLSDGNGNITPMTRSPYDAIQFTQGNNLYPSSLSLEQISILSSSNNINLVSKFNAVNGQVVGEPISNEINFRDYDSILIPENLEFLGLALKRVDNDLVLFSYDNSLATPVILKNYFGLSQTETHLYYTDVNGDKLGELTQNDMAKYFVLTNTNQSNIDLSVNYTQNNSYNGAVAVGINNVLTGSSGNNYLLSGSFTTLNPGANFVNNILNGGTGKNTFEISDVMTQNIINNFKEGDNVLVQVSHSIFEQDLSNYSLTTSRDGNDLIITRGYGTEFFNSIVVNYFNSMSLADAKMNSGIYISDIYGNKEVDLTSLWEDVKNVIYATDSDSHNLDESQNSTVTKIVGGAGNDNIIGNDNGNTIYGGGGNDTITGGKGVNTFYFNPANGDEGSSVITDFKGNADLLYVGVDDFDAVSATENDNDLIFYFYSITDNESPVASITLEGYYNLANTDLDANSNITFYDNSGDSKILSNTDINNYLNNSIYNTVSVINGINTIDASRSYRNTVMTSSVENTTFIGSQHNDIVTGQGNDIFYLSNGNDTYNFNNQNGIDTLKYNNSSIINLFNGTNHDTIQLDSSISKDDVSFYYDQDDSLLTILTGVNNGIKIQNVDESSLALFSQLFSVKTSNGENLLSDSGYQVLIGEPLGNITSSNPHYTFSNNIYYGDNTGNTIATYNSNSIVDDGYGNDTIEALKGNNLLFGGNGNDSIYTNSYLFGYNSSSQASIVIGGEDSDSLYLGNKDLAIFTPGDGDDTINYTSNNDNFTLSFMQGADDLNDSSNFALYAATDGQNLILAYNENNKEDSVTLTNFWNLPHDNIKIALTEEAQQGNSHVVRSYSLDDILNTMNINSNSDTDSIFTIHYGDIQNVMQGQDFNNILGGVIAQNYLINTTIEGISQSSTNNVLNNMNNVYLSPIDNNPSGSKI